MSVPYHTDLFNNGHTRLIANFSGIKEDIADELVTFHLYAVNKDGRPVFTEELNIQEIRELYSHLHSLSVIREGAKKSSKFVETTDEINLILNHLKEGDLGTILDLLSKFKSDAKIKGLLESLSDLEIENLHGAFHHRRITSELKNLENLLDLEEKGNVVSEIGKYPHLVSYRARQPERVFQNWIQSNLWVFGVDYIKKHDVRKIALFSEGDLLMESVDGYLDLIELKRPSHELLKFDGSHACHYPHSDLSQVIGQSLFYLQKLDEYKLILEDEYKVKIIMPRIKIVLGRSRQFCPQQRDCIRLINSNLTAIKIITYDDLLTFGNVILNSLEERSFNV